MYVVTPSPILSGLVVQHLQSPPVTGSAAAPQQSNKCCEIYSALPLLAGLHLPQLLQHHTGAPCSCA